MNTLTTHHPTTLEQQRVPVLVTDPLDSLTYFDLIRTAWHRKGLLLLGIVGALIIGALYFARATPVYESSAEVLVIKKRPEIITGDQVYASRSDDYLTTHTALIKSPAIAERAVATHGLTKLKTFSNPKYTDPKLDPTTALLERISVKLGSKEGGRDAAHILTVSFRGPVATECVTVVQAILDSYRSFLEESYRNQGEDSIALIGRARDELQLDLSKKETAYREFRRKSPLIPSGTSELNPRESRLNAIETQLSEVLLRATSFQRQLQQIEKAKQDNLSKDDLVALVSNLANESGTNDGTDKKGLDGQLFSLLQELERSRQNYGPNHPHVRSIKQQIDATRSFYALPSASYQVRMPSAGDNSNLTDPVDLYTSYLRQELAGLKISEQLLNDLYAKEHAEAKQHSDYELEAEGIRQSIDRTRVLYDEVVSKLHGASLVRDYDGFDPKVISPPMIGEKVAPNPLLIFPLAAFAGGLFGIVLVFTAETTDRRFRTTADIVRELGCPIVGTAPEYLPIAKKELRNPTLDGMLYAFHKPNSNITEVYRGVRTALYFSTHGKAHKTIQITSAGPGDGKSTLTSNLATCIAQSGKSVLLIDGDMRRPRMHRIFGVSNEVGLASVIGLDTELDDAILGTTIPNLSVIPSGPLPPDPSELLSSHRFQELLNSVRDTFDYVLIDTGPLLAITDPSVIASRVDGVVLTIRITKNSRAQARQARDLLASLGSNLLGVFVNGVPNKSSPYGSDYNYSYMYKYTPALENATETLPR